MALPFLVRIFFLSEEIHTPYSNSFIFPPLWVSVPYVECNISFTERICTHIMKNFDLVLTRRHLYYTFILLGVLIILFLHSEFIPPNCLVISSAILLMCVLLRCFTLTYSFRVGGSCVVVHC